LLGGLKLFADLFAGEWIIDTIAAVPKLLSLRKSVCAALFLCDNDIDIDLPALGDCGLQYLTRMRRFIHELSEHNVAHSETEGRH
jgi:hypothetical protein